MNSLRAQLPGEYTANALYKFLFINRLAEIAENPVIQGALAVHIIGEGSHKNSWNGSPLTHQMPMELESGHCRHMNVGNQENCLIKMGRCQKLCCRWI